MQTDTVIPAISSTDVRTYCRSYKVPLRDVGTVKSRRRRKAKRESQVTRDYLRNGSVVNERKSKSSQWEPDTTLSVVNTTLLSWYLIEEGHRDVDAGQDTLLPGIVVFVAYLLESSKGVQERSATGGDIRVPDCPLSHVPSCVSNLLDASIISASHDTLMLVVRICLSPYTDTVYGAVSVSNTSGALILFRVAPLYSYRYAIPSHYYMHAVPWVDYCTVTLLHCHYYTDVAR